TMGKGVGVAMTTSWMAGSLLSNTITASSDKKYLHSISRWCFQSFSLQELIDFCLENGIQSIELLEPDEYKIVVKKGLQCAVANSPATHIQRGFNEPALHDYLFKEYQRLIPLAADAVIPNIICFSGNKNGMTDEKGIENCAAGLEKVIKLAEQYGINLIMELLNSKIDHADYQCDHTPWGVRLVQKMGSERFKLLYDVYHMQIMEGDIIRTIRENIQHVAHFHLAGVPGRNDLDETQELNYKAIVRAIKETGYTGFFGQEFLPKNNTSLLSLIPAIELVEQS